ncbi:hypothetical protein L1887_57479 [Cichorium endivia]|nr:hypothetical protein L1887_57479 [Cichorium endivia]
MGIVLHGGPHDSSVARAWPTTRAFGGPRPLLLVGKQAAGTRVASSPDSDLEAFSHNPAHGSFAPLAFQPSAMTNCANQRSKGSLGHAFTVRIRTGNQNQTSFYPSVPHEISVLVELILGHLRYLLTDVPPQPNSPPDNVFRPDRPAEAGLGSKKRGIAPLPIHGIIGFPLSVPVLSWAVRRPGEGPRRSRSQSVPRPARGDPLSPRKQLEQSADSRRVRGLGPPCPALRAQSFSRGYGSILPTSLAYIVPSTRGCSPWRPDAVMSTTGRGRHSVLRIFKGPPGAHRTPRDIRTDGRSAQAHAQGFAATAAPSYSSGPGTCPDGRVVSAQFGTVTRLPVHPASPVLLTKNGPLGALDSVARLNEAAAPSYLFKNSHPGSSYPEGNFGGNQLLDGSISFAPIPKSDERFARQYRCGPPPEFPLASPRSGIVHHLSGPDRHAHTRTLLRRSRSVGGAPR